MMKFGMLVKNTHYYSLLVVSRSINIKWWHWCRV